MRKIRQRGEARDQPDHTVVCGLHQFHCRADHCLQHYQLNGKNKPLKKLCQNGCVSCISGNANGFTPVVFMDHTVEVTPSPSVMRHKTACVCQTAEHWAVSECQKGRVVKTTYQHFPLDSRPCQNARWVVLTPCENSPFVSECIVALYRNGTLSALDGYIVTLEFAHPVQHYHFDPERSTLDTYIRSQLNCGILTPNGTFTTHRCAHTQ